MGVKYRDKPSGKGVTTMGAVKAVGTPVLLQACLCRGHVLHAVGTVVRVHLMAYTETTPDKQALTPERHGLLAVPYVKTMSAEVQLAYWFEAATAATILHLKKKVNALGKSVWTDQF